MSVNILLHESKLCSHGNIVCIRQHFISLYIQTMCVCAHVYSCGYMYMYVYTLPIKMNCLIPLATAQKY